MKHKPILIFLACNIKKELGINDCSFANLSLRLSLLSCEMQKS